MHALVDVHHLGDAEARREAHERVRVEARQPGLEREKLDGVPERDLERLVEVADGQIGRLDYAVRTWGDGTSGMIYRTEYSEPQALGTRPSSYGSSQIAPSTQNP